MTGSRPNGDRPTLPEGPFPEPIASQSPVASTADAVDEEVPLKDASHTSTSPTSDRKKHAIGKPLVLATLQNQTSQQPQVTGVQPDGDRKPINMPTKGSISSDASSTRNSSAISIATVRTSSTVTSDGTTSEQSAATASKIPLKELPPPISQQNANATIPQPPENSSGPPPNKPSRPSQPAPGAHVQFSHTPFIQKLYAMLEDPNMEHVIIWSENGDSFLVNPSTEFSQLLCLYFKHTNISSFVRQLSMCGFHKVVPSHGTIHSPSSKNPDFPWEFRHCDGAFRRGDIEALRTIKRRSSRHTNPSKRQRIVNAWENTGFTQQAPSGGHDPGNMHSQGRPPPQASQSHPQQPVVAQPQQQQQMPLLAGHNQGPSDAVYAKFTYRHPSMGHPSGVMGHWPMLPRTSNVQSHLPSLGSSSMQSNSVNSHFSSVSSMGSSVSHAGSQQIGHPSMAGPMPKYTNMDSPQGDNVLDFLMQAQHSLQLQISELSRAVVDIRSAMEHIRWSENARAASSKPASPEVTPTEPLEPALTGSAVQQRPPSSKTARAVDDETKSPKSVQDAESTPNEHLGETAGAGLAAGPETQDRIKLESLLN